MNYKYCVYGNLFFLLFSAGGFGGIFFNHLIPWEYSFSLPVGMVALYAAITGLLMKKISDPECADHTADSIYFLGFLYTLIALVSLFFRFYRADAAAAGPAGTDTGALVDAVFFYLGISVTTSIAGVLFRSMIRGGWLGRRSRTQTPEDSRELLQAIADTLDPVRQYLEERSSRAEEMERREEQYLNSLGKFIRATDDFSSQLSRAREDLSGQLVQFSDAVGQHREGMREFSRLSSSFTAAADEMARFSLGSRELNSVLDSLITLLESKVERVR